MDFFNSYKPVRLRIAATASLMTSLLCLQGCTVGPKYVRPNVQAPPAFKESAPQQSADGTLWKPVNPQDATLRSNWWEIYQEPELNALEDKLNHSNQNIAQSYQNFMAARAQVRQARASYSPTVTTTPAYTRSRTSASQLGGAAGSTNLNSNEFDLPFDVSWEPDVWGRIRNTVREYANAAQASAADLANERLTEQANLAVDYFELRGQDSQIDLYQKTIEAYRRSLELTRTLGSTGIDSEQAVAQAEKNLKTAGATATNLGISRAQYEHAIALLIGEPASTFSLPHHPLTTDLPAVPIGLPSDLLQRRPDIAEAERTMSQANALIGVETAAFYPSFSITANGGFESPNIGSWLTWPSRFFSIGPSASETLFDAGLRRATMAQYTAQYNADVAAYRQTVLTAFQQTEDYIATERILGQQMQQQNDAIAAAQHYLDLENIRYKTGVDPYLDVATAETSLLTNQQTEVTLRIQQMTSNVQLIEALGGGWDVSQLPSTKSVGAKK